MIFDILYTSNRTPQVMRVTIKFFSTFIDYKYNSYPSKKVAIKAELIWKSNNNNFNDLLEHSKSE